MECEASMPMYMIKFKLVPQLTFGTEQKYVHVHLCLFMLILCKRGWPRFLHSVLYSPDTVLWSTVWNLENEQVLCKIIGVNTK